MVIGAICILHANTKHGELHIAGAGAGGVYDTGNDFLAVSQCNVIPLNSNVSDVSRFECLLLKYHIIMMMVI